ncbi:MAG: hypothetical protein ACUVQ6_06100 [Dissulfurimicrobium sp.]|uniref:hypothetical protein n=1 Tax=Dissulfurimicrobium sp. TaxID=2022436 RepID=UPI00404B90DC
MTFLAKEVVFDNLLFARSGLISFGDRIPLGVIYEAGRPVFEDHFPALKNGPLAAQETCLDKLETIIAGFA